MIWLVWVARRLYQKELGFLTGTTRLSAAVIFYIVFIAGLTFFVLLPAIEKQSVLYAILAGSFFGLICYGTYDLTNLATIKNWPVTITVVDIIWGTALNGATSGIVYWLVQKFNW